MGKPRSSEDLGGKEVSYIIVPHNRAVSGFALGGVVTYGVHLGVVVVPEPGDCRVVHSQVKMLSQHDRPCIRGDADAV